MATQSPSSQASASKPELQSRTLKLAQHEDSGSSSEDDEANANTSKREATTPTKSPSSPRPTFSKGDGRDTTQNDEMPAVTSPSQSGGASVTTSSPASAASAPQSTTPAPAPRAEQEQEPGNDAVTALQAMFPGMDRTIISEVLAAHGGNADAASIALLELNNPEAAPASNADTQAASAAQLHADEEYARHLMLQMEQEHMREYGRPLGSAPPASLNDRRQANSNSSSNNNQNINYDRLNYVPRQRSRPQQLQQQSTAQPGHNDGADQNQGGPGQWFAGQTGPDGRWKHQDELDQLSEQLGKMAENANKTFNSLYSKAKEKYALAAQQRALQNQGNQQQQNPSERGDGPAPKAIAGFKLPAIPSPWTGGGGYKPDEKPMSPEREELRTGGMSPDSRSSVLRDYSQSPVPPSKSSSANRTSLEGDRPGAQINKPLPSGGSQAQPVRAGPSTSAPTLSSSPATASPAFSTSPSHLPQGRTSFSSSSPAKVQMLPRQTINLLDQSDKDRNSRSGSPGAAGAAGALGAGAGVGLGASSVGNRRRDDDDSDSDSDVEYVRNPFNDDD